MTKQEAIFTSRKIAKKSVRNYFNSNPKEMFNWDVFGSLIIKKELSCAFKIYVAHYNILTREWCVMNLNGNKIITI